MTVLSSMIVVVVVLVDHLALFHARSCIPLPAGEVRRPPIRLDMST